MAKILGSTLLFRNTHILYYNARSLLPKLSELQLLAGSCSPDIICITESWISKEIRDSELFIPGYHLTRMDRNRNGGGVLMYVSSSLHFFVLPKCDGLELLSIMVSNGTSKVCISLFYRPPNSPVLFLDMLSTYIESLNIHRYTNFILLGDFNINFLSPCNNSMFSKLLSLCNLFSFNQM